MQRLGISLDECAQMLHEGSKEEAAAVIALTHALQHNDARAFSGLLNLPLWELPEICIDDGKHILLYPFEEFSTEMWERANLYQARKTAQHPKQIIGVLKPLAEATLACYSRFLPERDEHEDICWAASHTLDHFACTGSKFPVFEHFRPRHNNTGSLFIVADGETDNDNLQKMLQAIARLFK